QRHSFARRYVADPVVRQIGAGEHQIARLELADKVADEVAAGGGDDQVDLVFRMEVPTHGTEGIAVSPRLERLTASDLDDFQVRIHCPFLPAPVQSCDQL